VQRQVHYRAAGMTYLTGVPGV